MTITESKSTCELQASGLVKGLQHPQVNNSIPMMFGKANIYEKSWVEDISDSLVIKCSILKYCNLNPFYKILLLLEAFCNIWETVCLSHVYCDMLWCPCNDHVSILIHNVHRCESGYETTFLVPDPVHRNRMGWITSLWSSDVIYLLLRMNWVTANMILNCD